MGASGVNGRRVLSAALSNELIESMAEVLDLTGSQDAAHSHQLGVVRVVVTPSGSRVDVATSSERPVLHLQSLSRSCPRQSRRGCFHS